MNARSLTGRIRKVAKAAGADLVGFAGADRFHQAPPGRGPKDHLPSAKSVVVVARKIPDSAIDRWGKPPAKAITSYRTYGHGPINTRLVFIIQDIVSCLEEAGYEGLTTDIRPPAEVTAEAVLEACAQRDPWQTTGFFGDIGPWCGRCLQVCVYGRDTHQKRIQKRDRHG